MDKDARQSGLDNMKRELTRLRRENRRIRAEREDSYIRIGSRLSDLEDSDRKPDSHRSEQAPKAFSKQKKGMGWFQSEAMLMSSMFIVAGVGIVAILLLPMLLKAGRGTRVYSYHPTFRAAASAGELQEGWLPRFIPDGSTEVHEVHDAKTGVGWITFVFPPKAGKNMAGKFGKLKEGEIAGLVVPSTPDNWWPPVLKGRLPGGKAPAGWELFRTNRTMMKGKLIEYIAVDWGNSRAYVWR